jgi:hypothetical protein
VGIDGIARYDRGHDAGVWNHPRTERLRWSFLGYLLGVPSAIVIGIAILWTEAKLATALVIRAKGRSKKIKNVVGLSLLLFQLCWIVIGGTIGFRLAAFISVVLKATVAAGRDI